jgi:hypothetical protein
MKKVTTKQRRGGKAAQAVAALATLRERATIIIEDRQRDIDTRLAVQLALTNETDRTFPEDADSYVRDLREAVTRAEAGAVLSRVEDLDPQTVEAARAVLALYEMPGKPDFILDALTVLLSETERQIGCRLYHYLDGREETEPGGYSLESLASVFANHPLARVEIGPRFDLAGHLAAVLADPATPASVYNTLQESLSGMVNHRDTMHSPDVIRVALEVGKRASA